MAYKIFAARLGFFKNFGAIVFVLLFDRFHAASNTETPRTVPNLSPRCPIGRTLITPFFLSAKYDVPSRKSTFWPDKEFDSTLKNKCEAFRPCLQAGRRTIQPTCPWTRMMKDLNL
jgi:hypothetical protein